MPCCVAANVCAQSHHMIFWYAAHKPVASITAAEIHKNKSQALPGCTRASQRRGGKYRAAPASMGNMIVCIIPLINTAALGATPNH